MNKITRNTSPDEDSRIYFIKNNQYDLDNGDNYSSGSVKKNRKINNHHRTFLKNERAFYDILCHKIGDRRFDVKAQEFYNEARLTKPTFYLHFANCAQTRESYESKIELGFYEKIPIGDSENNYQAKITRSYILEILVIHILQNQQYFLATHRGSDHYLLTKILWHYRHYLVGNRLSDRSFYAYVISLQTVIACWLEFDELNHSTAKTTAKKLTRVKVIDYS